MYRIGIDLGGTNIAGGVVDGNHNIIAKASVPTNKSSSERIADDIAALCLRLCREAGISPKDAVSIGIGAPGIVDSGTGVVEYVCNLPMRYYPLTDEVARRLGVAKALVKAENDANAAALGEMLAGSGKGSRDFMMITLGTGVGGGVIHNGRILTSHNHAGGELGHTVIVAGGEKCGCGRLGCAEAYCSATALIRMANEALSSGGGTLLSSCGDIDGKKIFEAAEKGDAVALSVLEKYEYYVAVMLANFINIFQPQVLAVGGGISGAGDAFLAPLGKLIFPDMIYNRDQPEELYTSLRLATLGGDAGIIGAAFL